MFTQNIIIHTSNIKEERKKPNSTWLKRVRIPHMQKISQNMSLVRRPCKDAGIFWQEKLWIPKPRLNLGPIISAPAAKGNFSTSPHNSHHLWDLRLWRHTWGILLLKFIRVFTCFVPVFRQSTFCLPDAHCNTGLLAFCKIVCRAWKEPKTIHVQNRNRLLNARMVQKRILLHALASATPLLYSKMDCILQWPKPKTFMSTFVLIWHKAKQACRLFLHPLLPSSCLHHPVLAEANRPTYQFLKTVM